MKLDQRLRLLRGEAAPTPARVPALPSDPSTAVPESWPEPDALSERLRRLSAAPRCTTPRRRPDETALAAVLGAGSIEPGVLCVERRFPLTRRQGRPTLGACVRALPELMDGPLCGPEGWLFLDTETSGLAGGTGTWAFVTGLARIDGQELLLRQYLLTRLDAEPAYLAAIRAELERAGLLVSYNGKSFDAPLLTTRLCLAGLRCRLDAKPHLDLLHPVRRAFSRVWPDCRLATVERLLLGLQRQGDLPGAEAPRAWLGWLRQGETAPLDGVLDHNRQDLLSLPALVSALLSSLYRPAAAGADVAAVAGHWLSRGDETMAFSVLSQDRSGLDANGLLALARLHRRRGEWRDAHRIWQSLADQGDSQATEALIKYLEHRDRDYAQALALVDRLPAGPAREHRRRRLEHKLRTRWARLRPAV